MQEIWKDIPEYCGHYQVSNLGRVRSKDRLVENAGHPQRLKGKILKQTKQSNGYLNVNLCINNKRKRHLVHRLVAKQFIDNKCNKPHINHKDENKSNNRADNLEWCDQKYNSNYGTAKQRISAKKKKPVFCVELNLLFESQMDAHRKTGVHGSAISLCCKKPNRTAGGYHWKFAEG